MINACCQACRRAKRAAKEEEILAQSALSLREAFGWLERCVPVALARVLSLLCISDVQASPHVRVPGLGVRMSGRLREQPFVSTCTLHCFQVLAPSQLVALPAVPGMVP